MGSFRYIPSREVDARHRAARVTAAPMASPRESRIDSIPQQRNVQTVLSLGDTRYILFQHHVYRIPIVSFKLGQRVLDLHIRVLTGAKQIALHGQDKDTKAYYKDLGILARVLWSHMEPASRGMRWLRRVGLMRNPLMRASEKELMTLTDFFLQGRMTSSVQSMPEMALIPSREIPMS